MSKKTSKQKRCRGCRRFLALDWRHNFCRKCRKLVKLGKEVAHLVLDKPAVVKEPKREVYLGKKDLCALCEELTHLVTSKIWPKPICQECKTWIEVKLKGLPSGAASF